MPPAVKMLKVGVVVIGLLHRVDRIRTRKELKAYKQALASSHAQTMYLAGKLDENGIELDDFDIIAMHAM